MREENYLKNVYFSKFISTKENSQNKAFVFIKRELCIYINFVLNWNRRKKQQKFEENVCLCLIISFFFILCELDMFFNLKEMIKIVSLIRVLYYELFEKNLF